MQRNLALQLRLLVATLGGEVRKLRVSDPLGRPVKASFAILPDGRAVVEMAQASGLALVKEGERDAWAATTRGTGELIVAAVEAGANEVLVTVGGSATTDPKDLIAPKPNDLLFPDLRAHHLNAVLDEQRLKADREGLRRSAYSLRHTYICLRLMEGADIYQIAKNCRTSVEMIEKYYASHLKDRLDTSAINVMRPRNRRNTS